MMHIEFKECEPIGTNAYCVFDLASNTAILIDAPLGSYNWCQSLCKQHNCELIAGLLTHGHWDHILDAHYFNKDKIPLYGHLADQMLFEKPELMIEYAIPGIHMNSIKVDHWIAEDKLSLGSFALDVFEVPGHCPGSLMFYMEALNTAFVGDAIFAGGIGRCDLPGGNFDRLKNSIVQKIYTLPLETKLFPGHGPSTSVSHERRSNPFVKIS
jgi:hydroxyacylglutathione hydrolase